MIMSIDKQVGLFEQYPEHIVQVFGWSYVQMNDYFFIFIAMAFEYSVQFLVDANPYDLDGFMPQLCYAEVLISTFRLI